MFQVKICGITNARDALTVAQAGADAIGINFYARSPRYVTTDVARQIAKAVPKGIVKVGLFVDTPAGQVCRLFDDLQLDLIQIHGDQPPEFLAQLGSRPVMRAFRVGPEGLAPVTAYLHRCRQLKARPALTLFDSSTPGLYGGTGKTGSWKLARQYVEQPDLPPLVLAGGLTCENVMLAILAVRPAGVDAASGVESRPGRKDPIAVAAFVEAARTAFAQ